MNIKKKYMCTDITYFEQLSEAVLVFLYDTHRQWVGLWTDVISSMDLVLQ